MDPKNRIEFFIDRITKGQFLDIMNRFDDEKFKIIFDNLFTKIERGPGILELWSHTFVIGIMTDKINHISPLFQKNKELKDKWKSLSIEEQLRIFLDDFKERIKLTYRFNL